MGFDKVKKKSSGNLVSDTPFIHIDITGTFFVLKPSVGEVLEVTVIKKGDGHLGALLHDVFNVSIFDSKLAKRDINLGDSVLVKVVSLSNIRLHNSQGGFYYHMTFLIGSSEQCGRETSVAGKPC